LIRDVKLVLPARWKIWEVTWVGYMPAMWVSFGEALTAVAGALMGLLFVAVSVKSDVLAASRGLSSRPAQTLVLFGISVFIAIFLVAPQPHAALGSELLAVSTVSGAALLILDHAALLELVSRCGTEGHSWRP
jgi:hypothetical protein